jgi:DNA-binding NtrC family response regulator
MGKILIIDDNQEFTRILSMDLGRRGYAVQCAYTGADGLALIERDSPHLVFLDLRLPDTDGVELLGRIKTACADSRVVITTGYPHLSSALAAIRSQVVDYLCKPFSLDDLGPILDRVFGPGQPRPRPAPPAPDEADAVEIARAVNRLPNHITVEGHTDGRQFTVRENYSNWELSTDRTNSARRIMEAAGCRRGRSTGWSATRTACPWCPTTG